MALGVAFVGPFLPVYTVTRGRVYRGVKWVAIIGVVAFAFGPDALKCGGVADGITGQLHRLKRAEDDQRSAHVPERRRGDDDAAGDE